MNYLEKTFGTEKRWVSWRFETDGKKKQTKVPYNINGRKASSTDPLTWSTYDDVKKIGDKVGIIFTPEQTLLGIDIDHCLKDGEIVHADKEKIEALISEANSYTEISPSQEGLHIYLSISAPLELVAHKKAPFEVYTSGRFFTVTGTSFGKEKSVRTVTLEEALRLLAIAGYPWKKEVSSVPVKTKENEPAPNVTDDVRLLSKMFDAKNGASFGALYGGDISEYENDASRADMALCAHLAFWTAKNASQMERMWVYSPLGQREKIQSRKDYRDRTITTAVSGCAEVYKPRKEKSKESRTPKENLLLKEICSREDVTLFHDEQGDAYISLEIGGHQETWPCKGKAMKRLLASKTWETEKTALGSESIKSMVTVLEGKACFEGAKIKLHNRVAFNSDELFYDLTNEKWQAVKINKDGWEVVDKPPILFRRYSHNKAQIIPSRDGDIRLFLDCINITSPEQRLLIQVFLVACFIPDFPHAMLTVFGAQGSSKSTLSKLLRLLVDPSMIEVAGLPKSQKELVQMLAHHYFLFFDNVSYISDESSDILCKAITGGGFSKRELYENDEDIIYSFKRSIGINGVNLVTTRPDLLERSLLVELERFSETERKTEGALYEKFEKDLPIILGGVFDVIVETLKRKSSIHVSLLPRMADWTLWGCAISEALGYKKEEFLTAYRNNITHQTEMLLNDNIVAVAITTFMEDKDEWKDTPTELFEQLCNHSAFYGIDTREKYWPKGANVLSRRLNELSTPLKQMGISVVISTSGSERYIHIKKVSSSLVEITQIATTDDTDDIFEVSPKQFDFGGEVKAN